MCISEKQIQLLNELKQQYVSGLLNVDELAELLMTEIDHELDKPETDTNSEWLDACGNLLVFVDHNNTTDQKNQMDSTWQSLLNQINVYNQAKFHNRVRSFVRIAAIAVLLVGISIVSIRYAWLVPSQTPDGQEYILTGKEFQISLSEAANASESTSEPEEIDTDDISVLYEFLGFIPKHPTWLPHDWILANCFAYRDTETVIIDIEYESANQDNSISYNCTYTSNPSALSTSIFQDGVGKSELLADGRSVYITMNEGSLGVSWYDDVSCYYLTGQISWDDMHNIVLNVK